MKKKYKMSQPCGCKTCGGKCFDSEEPCEDCVNYSLGDCMWCTNCNEVCNKDGPCIKECSEESEEESEELSAEEEISEIPDLEIGKLNTKRTDYLSWDQYFMGIAILSAQRSKDPSTQVGACIVTPDKKIVGIGYNGFPTGIPDDSLPWGKTDNDPLNNKYFYVCHSELNAILNSTQNLKGCTLYVSLFPCNECAKTIIQSGIKKVIYADDKHSETAIVQASKKMLTLAEIDFVEYKKANKQVTIEI